MYPFQSWRSRTAASWQILIHVVASGINPVEKLLAKVYISCKKRWVERWKSAQNSHEGHLSVKAHGVFQHIPNKPSATGHLCDDMIILCHFPRMLRQGLEKLGYFFNWLGWFLGMHTEKWVGSGKVVVVSGKIPGSSKKWFIHKGLVSCEKCSFAGFPHATCLRCHDWWWLLF